MLVRHAKTPDRDLVLARLMSCLGQRTLSLPATPNVATDLIATQVGAEAQLPLVQEATTRRCVLQIQYFSAHRGQLGWRDISPARLSIGPPARVLALCHRTGTLKWFRVSNIVAARLLDGTTFREAPPTHLEEVLATSLNGYHDGEHSVVCRFSVRNPDARWVKANLPHAAKVTDTGDGITVEIDAGALVPLARLVVGLGDAASVETPALDRLVKHLARGALRISQSPRKRTLRAPRRLPPHARRD
jgi:predicted DNA-binding transcriptional regulator YafY